MNKTMTIICDNRFCDHVLMPPIDLCDESGNVIRTFHNQVAGITPDGEVIIELKGQVKR